MTELWNSQEAQCRLRFFYEEEETLNTPFYGNYLKIFAVSSKELHIGLGKRENLDEKRVSCAVAKGFKFAKNQGYTSMVVEAGTFLEILPATVLCTAAQSASLALYEYKAYRSNYQKKTYQIYFDTCGTCTEDTASKYFQEANVLAEAVMFARDLVNEPANLLHPQAMAQKIADKTSLPGVTVNILDEEQTRALGMEAFLTVGLSAAHAPRLIVLRYDGNPGSTQRIALVGKGVTCDTGGYCLKERNSMLGIKGDMAGAAAVSGALWALAKNQVNVNAVAVIPAVENRISRESFIPGDVIQSMAGKSIEIGNTDAEGRLILADAVTYAIREQGATKIVDIATLTGAVVAMFGFTTAGLMADNDDFYHAFQKAETMSGEQYWRLPMFPEYAEMIEGNHTDLRNISSSGCGTLTAGLFIHAFAEGLPWIHLDIAGTAWVDTPKWDYQSKGATGAGVTTLYYLCKDMAQEEAK